MRSSAESDGQTEGHGNAGHRNRRQERQAQQDHYELQPAAMQDLHHFANHQRTPIRLLQQAPKGI